jgi:hypothetical protein
MRCALRQQRGLNPLCGMRAGYLCVTGAFDMPVSIRFLDPFLAPFTAVKRSRYTRTGTMKSVRRRRDAKNRS